MSHPIQLPQNGQVFDDPVELYSLCAHLLLLPQTDHRNRCIDIASLHGHVGRRSTARTATDQMLASALGLFGEAMRSRITSTSEPWKVRQVFSVGSRERLDQLAGWQMGLNGERLEIRAVAERGMLPTLSPLIIGNEHVLLAMDDSLLYRVSSAVYFHGSEAAAWARAHFDDIWGIAPWILRDRIGVRHEQIDQLRRSLPDVTGLHPKVAAVAQGLFDSQHYGEAVRAAFQAIENRIQLITGSTAYGVALMAKAFNPGSPLLDITMSQGSDLDGERTGFRNIFVGVMEGLRNTRSHGPASSDEHSEALEYLTVASMLMRRIDVAESRLS